MEKINLELFNKIIAARGDNLQIFNAIFNEEIIRNAMLGIIRSMSEAYEGWDYDFVIKPDNKLWEGKQNDFYQGKAVLAKKIIEEILGDRLGFELNDDDRNVFSGQLDINEIENAGLYKIIRYRFLEWKEKAFLVNKEDSTKNLEKFGFLITKFHDVRGMCAHKEKNIYDSVYMITYIEDMIACIPDACCFVTEKVVNGKEIAKELQKFKVDLEEFLEAFKLSENNQPIKKDSNEEFGAEYLYGFDVIYIAYLSLRDDNYNKFIMGRLLPLMVKGESKLAIDNGTVEYLAELCGSRNSTQSHAAGSFVKELENSMRDYVKFKKNISSIEDVHYTDSFCRNLKSTERSVCVITDDEVLEESLLKLPENIICVNVTDREHVSPYHGRSGKGRSPERKKEPELKAEEETFIKIPESGARVYYGEPSQNMQYELKECIGSGGEGKVYATDIGTECFKIYHADKLSQERKNKIADMLSIKNKIPKNICWPIEQIFESSSRHTAVGFSMMNIKAISGGSFIPLEELIIRIQARGDVFDEWDRKKIVKLCLGILMDLKALHSQNVLIGDINPRNIMVDKNANLLFIDMDSCQIGDYLTNVGKMEFASPRILKRSSGFKNIKRTMSDEYYAEAVLLYYVLTLGSLPYDLEGESINSANIKDAIRNKRFKSFDDDTDYIWENFSENVKTNFSRVFQSNDNEDYPDDDEWLKAFLEMEKEIFDGEKGRLSNKLFPSDGACKKGMDWSLKTCEKCGRVFDVSNNNREKLCVSCRKVKIFNKSIIYKRKCSRCGRTFTENLWDASGENGDIKPEEVLCPDCNQKARLCGELELEQTEFKKTFAAIKANFERAERELKDYD